MIQQMPSPTHPPMRLNCRQVSQLDGMLVRMTRVLGPMRGESSPMVEVAVPGFHGPMIIFADELEIQQQPAQVKVGRWGESSG